MICLRNSIKNTQIKYSVIVAKENAIENKKYWKYPDFVSFLQSGKVDLLGIQGQVEKRRGEGVIYLADYVLVLRQFCYLCLLINFNFL